MMIINKFMEEPHLTTFYLTPPHPTLSHHIALHIRISPHLISPHFTLLHVSSPHLPPPSLIFSPLLTSPLFSSPLLHLTLLLLTSPHLMPPFSASPHLRSPHLAVCPTPLQLASPPLLTSADCGTVRSTRNSFR